MPDKSHSDEVKQGVGNTTLFQKDNPQIFIYMQNYFQGVRALPVFVLWRKDIFYCQFHGDIGSHDSRVVCLRRKKLQYCVVPKLAWMCLPPSKKPSTDLTELQASSLYSNVAYVLVLLWWGFLRLLLLINYFCNTTILAKILGWYSVSDDSKIVIQNLDI